MLDLNEHQQRAIRALEQMKGDDTSRAKAAWWGMTDQQMREIYGASGMSRQEILDGYIARDANIDATIEWVKFYA